MQIRIAAFCAISNIAILSSWFYAVRLHIPGAATDRMALRQTNSPIPPPHTDAELGSYHNDFPDCLLAAGAGIQREGIMPFPSEMMISTRRFNCRPAAVSLVAAG